MKWTLPLALIATLLCPSAFAENSWKGEGFWIVSGARASALTSFDAVGIEIFDSVSGGCMPSPDDVKKAAELQLRRNNFKIDNSSLLDAKLEIAVTGLRMTAGKTTDFGCAAAVDVALLVYVEGVPMTKRFTEEKPGQFYRTFDLTQQILVGGSSLQKRIEDEVQEAVDELFLETQRAKELLEKHFPEAIK